MVMQFNTHKLALATYLLTNTVSVHVTGFVQLGVKEYMTAKMPIPDCTWTAVPCGLGASSEFNAVAAMARSDPWVTWNNVIWSVVLKHCRLQCQGSAKSGGGVGNNMIFLPLNLTFNNLIGKRLPFNRNWKQWKAGCWDKLES
jgi:hypothetical protein